MKVVLTKIKASVLVMNHLFVTVRCGLIIVATRQLKYCSVIRLIITAPSENRIGVEAKLILGGTSLMYKKKRDGLSMEL
jgi:hypothetical protein